MDFVNKNYVLCQVNEISEELTEMEKSANKSSYYIHQLNEAIFKQRVKKLKNVTQAHLGSFSKFAVSS